MRIIGGKAKGRIIQFPSSSKERPTSDFLREALFNLLGPLPEKSFLDLFAGSGSVGIEAASRGAKEIIFIERDKKIAAIAQKNVTACGLDKQCRIISGDIGTGLGDLFKSKYVFDLVFADPPYCRGLVAETIRLLKRYPVFTEESLVIIQHSAREDVKPLLDTKTILKDQRKYGDNALTFFKNGVPMTQEKFISKIAVYPGSFDPITNGHVDIIKRGIRIFDEIIILVAYNPHKTSLFTVEERMEMINDSIGDISGVLVDSHSGLLVDYLKKTGANIILRGMRAVSDFEYEFQMALMNRRQTREIETVFLMSGFKWFYTGSQVIKEVASIGGTVKGLVPDNVHQKLLEKFKNGRR